MQYEVSPSGLAVPVSASEPEEPERHYGYLEFARDDARKDAYKALQVLVDLTKHNAFELDGIWELQEARRTLVMTVARLFLGSDVEFEELT